MSYSQCPADWRAPRFVGGDELVGDTVTSRRRVPRRLNGAQTDRRYRSHQAAISLVERVNEVRLPGLCLINKINKPLTYVFITTCSLFLSLIDLCPVVMVRRDSASALITCTSGMPVTPS